MIALQKRLAELVMRGPFHASMLAVTGITLSLAMPLLLFWMPWMSAAAVSLVWVVKGVRAGSVVLASALVGLMLIAFLARGDSALALAAAQAALSVWLPTVVLSELMRRRGNLNELVLLAAGMGLALLALIYLVVPDIDQRWQVGLEAFAAELDNMNADMGASQWPIEQIAPLLTSAMIVAVLSTGVMGVFWARHWQALLYRPGGFQQSFHALRLGQSASTVCVVLQLLALLMPQSWLLGMSMVCIAALVVQGLAVAHALVHRLGLSTGWLVALYIGLLFPQAATFVALVGVLDNWMDFRDRFAPSKKDPS